MSAHSLPPGRTFAANRRPGEGGRVGERRETEGPMCPQLPSLNLMGPELLLGGQAEQEVQGLREWTLLALKNPCSPASQDPRLQSEGNHSAPDSQMGRTHKSSALSVLPDTPPNREFCAESARELLAHRHKQGIHHLPSTTPSIVGHSWVRVAACPQLCDLGQTV